MDMANSPNPVSLREIEFQNYKAFERLRITLQSTNILVGPNNCGKSTVIGALRLLATALTTARARKPVEWIEAHSTFGYKIPSSSVSISLENVHTNYSDSPATITFKFDNGNALHLYFPNDSDCYLVPQVLGPAIRTPTNFRAAFPFKIAVVPILGPIEHNEQSVSQETVIQNLNTHRASRHFRNYWHYFPDGFDSFAEHIKRTWTGMTISRPELMNYPTEVFMFAQENRIPRELFWCGYGFQIWCQLLTHISRNQDADIIVVDEPEVYLHSDLQRQLLGLLKETSASVVIATHSTEIMGEADPTDLVVVDKNKSRCERLSDVNSVQTTLANNGSIHNTALVQLVRTRRALYLEGPSDFDLLRRIARRLGLKNFADGNRITPLSSGGFGAWKEIQIVAKRMKEATGAKFNIAAVFDRDYLPEAEIEDILNQLQSSLTFASILKRKEIENYLVEPNVLDRLIVSLANKQVGQDKQYVSSDVDSYKHLTDITDEMKHEVQAQYITAHRNYLRKLGHDESEYTMAATRWFDENWDTLQNRLRIVSGKEVLKRYRDLMQDAFNVSFSDTKVIGEFHRDEIPHDLVSLLTELDNYANPAQED